MLVYPGIIVSTNIDSVIELSNTSNQQIAVKCYYVNALGTCSTSGASCFATSNCPLISDSCLPQWVETDFVTYLTPKQPLAWLASRGLSRSDLPLDGIFHRGANGESNAGTQVPPFGINAANLGGQSGLGELKCYVVNPDGTPSDSNVLKGELSVQVTRGGASIFGVPVLVPDIAKDNAIGFRAIPGANNGDNQLVLGGDGAEYDGCPSTLILDHFFDDADDPVSGNTIRSALVLVPCTENFVNQVPAKVTAQYLVFNEFEQRFSTSRLVDCFFFSPLNRIDTLDPNRSIFSVYVAGTLTGQTRIRGVNGGLIGVAFENHEEGGTASFNLDLQGEREGGSDVVTVVQ